MKQIKISTISESVDIRTKTNLQMIEKIIQEYLQKFDTSKKLNFKEQTAIIGFNQE